jgi:MFS family permease
MKRSVYLLAIGQALLQTGSVLLFATGVLVGQKLAPVSSLATLPVALQFLGTMLTIVPASLFMQRAGRRRGFMLGAVLGGAGALVLLAATLAGSFWLFCGGTLLYGAYGGFGGYYRFAASEAASEDYRSRAIAYVLAGGVVAAIAGPNLAVWSRGILQTAYAGSYVVLVVLALAAVVPLALLRIPHVVEGAVTTGGRPLAEIARQPRFVGSAVAGTLGFAVMVLLMTATPLAMKAHPVTFGQTAFVIEWHMLGMFAPSFVTGRLIQRFGVIAVVVVGALLQLTTIGVNLLGSHLFSFWLALVCLGVGWNFLYVGATTLLTQTYRPAERAKTQAANDLIVAGAVAMASLSAGALQSAIGWRALNLVMVPFVAVVLVLALWLRGVTRSAGPSRQSV